MTTTSRHAEFATTQAQQAEAQGAQHCAIRCDDCDTGLLATPFWVREYYLTGVRPALCLPCQLTRAQGDTVALTTR